MLWREERASILANARCIVFKVGSAVLTNKEGIDYSVMQNLARQISSIAPLANGEARKVVLVTSAAIAAGRTVLARSCKVDIDTRGLAARQAAAAVGQGIILRAWDDAFVACGRATAQLLLTAEDFRAKERLLNAKNTFSELLEWGVIPIINENDTVSTKEIRFGDNDALSALIAGLINADLCINLTSASGVLGVNPSTLTSEAEREEKILRCIENIAGLNINALCGAKTSVGTGGMHSKLLAARRAAQCGIATCILPGKKEEILAKLFAGEDQGTWVRPFSHAVPRRKFWLAYKSAPVGSLSLDDGAAQALLHKGSSLLPGGIISVEGNFMAGALLRVLYNGESIGVGLTNYSSVELERIKGLKRIEVAAILGNAHYPEVIHRDNLLLDAAI